MQLIRDHQPILGVHPDNLAWFRGFLDQRHGDRATFEKFGAYILAFRDPASFDPEDLCALFFEMVPFAASTFNDHYAGLMTVVSDHMEQDRLSQQARAVTATNEAQKAMAQIDWIAQSVRLISLNASVEAARAGDAGAGFGVIAEEIRRLSDEIGAASGDVRSGLTLLLEEIES